MRPKTARKLTILDAMILVAAVACGMAMTRTFHPSSDVWLADPNNWFGRITNDPVKAIVVVPFLMTFTPAVLMIRMRRPRPRFRRLMRQPGMVASCAAAVPIAVSLLRLAHREWPGDSSAALNGIINSDPLFADCALDAGVWILAAWLVLWLSGFRRPERSRIDRVGRFVGAGWIVVLAVRILGSS